MRYKVGFTALDDMSLLSQWIKKLDLSKQVEFFGPPEGIRTPALQNRNLLRYPTAPRTEIICTTINYNSDLSFFKYLLSYMNKNLFTLYCLKTSQNQNASEKLFFPQYLHSTSNRQHSPDHRSRARKQTPDTQA